VVAAVRRARKSKCGTAHERRAPRHGGAGAAVRWANCPKVERPGGHSVRRAAPTILDRLAPSGA